MPWKNGGGITFEVAIFPPDASLDSLDWRVSMAQVETEGPFSRFAGIDRSLAIMQGHGLHLVVDGTGIDLGPRSPPLAFSGDVPVSAALVEGPIVDLNVMTRRGTWRHRLVHEPLNGTRSVVATADTTLFIVRGGIAGVGDESLRPRDALWLGAGERLSLVAEEGPADLFRIDLVRI